MGPTQYVLTQVAKAGYKVCNIYFYRFVENMYNFNVIKTKICIAQLST